MDNSGEIISSYDCLPDKSKTLWSEKLRDSVTLRSMTFRATEPGTFRLSEILQTQLGCDSIYSAVITVVQNQGGTDLPSIYEENIYSQEQSDKQNITHARIVFLNGQLYIRRENTLFDLSGRKIRTLKSE